MRSAGHLSLPQPLSRLKRRLWAMQDARKIARIVGESEAVATPRLFAGATPVGDHARWRGLPGRAWFSGAIRGTNRLAAALAKEHRDGRR